VVALQGAKTLFLIALAALKVSEYSEYPLYAHEYSEYPPRNL
jgi:hypothetical protein